MDVICTLVPNFDVLYLPFTGCYIYIFNICVCVYKYIYVCIYIYICNKLVLNYVSICNAVIDVCVQYNLVISVCLSIST